MKRVLCFIYIALLSATTVTAQDFAQHYYKNLKNDTAVHCITVSPRMMAEVMKSKKASIDDNMIEIISNLKSARIIEVAHRGKKYYERAEQQLVKNSNRFEILSNYDDENSSLKVGVRKRCGRILELVMIMHLQKTGEFKAINVTGDMDDVFIERLTRAIGKGRE